MPAFPEWAYSSVVEHYVDIVGVASSILATPTIPPNPPQKMFQASMDSSQHRINADKFLTRCTCAGIGNLGLFDLFPVVESDDLYS